MGSQKTGKMLVAAGAALYGCGCFVQPGQGPQAPTPAELAQVKVEQQHTAFSNEEPQQQSSQSSNWEGIAAGVALGLMVGLAGGASSAKAAGGPAVTGMHLEKSELCRIDDGCTGAKLQEWGKKMLKREEAESSYVQDKKYSSPSTGAGVYRKYGLDLASPLRGNGLNQPGEGYDGTYLIHERAHPWTGIYDHPNSDADALKTYNKYLASKNALFTYKNAPYKWDKSMWEK